MATLQMFKLFATQCAAVNIPTQSPTTSPLLHLRRRRRKTLRMLLTRRSHISDSVQPPPAHKRSKLKDLFFSASPTQHRVVGDDQEAEASSEIRPIQTSRDIIGSGSGSGSVRPVFQPFGYRNRVLLRKAWRPVLTTIEETQD